MKTISALTLGCKVNQYDTDAMLTLFREAGYETVPWGEKSDIALINTCTVTAVADKKSRSAIRQAARRGSRILVCGCLAQKSGDKLREVEGVAWIIGTADRAKAVEIVEGRSEQPCGTRPFFEEMRIEAPGEKTRAFIKIQEGCRNFCSYCIIPYVRGAPQSRPLPAVLAEVQRLTESGVPEIVLTGIDLSSYYDSGSDLADLIGEIEKSTDAERVRLGSLEPGVFSAEFTEKIARSGILCPHFHLSLQSGSERILQKMNRHYTPGEYLEELLRLRQAFVKPAISTDLMTGFPGEDEEDHASSMKLVEKAAFSRVHVFPYSERPGTAAVRLQKRVPKAVRKKRALELIALGERLEDAYARTLIGSPQEVLFEEEEDGFMAGYCGRYVRIRAKNGTPGKICRVVPTEMKNGCLIGTVNWEKGAKEHG